MASASGMTNKIQWSDLKTKIKTMADTMDEDEIADLCRCSIGQVRLALQDTKAKPWWVIDNKTGRTWQPRSQRGAYRIVCMHGLTDWDWGQAEMIGENPQP